MATSLPRLCRLTTPSHKRKSLKGTLVRSQSFYQEGSSENNDVDANLCVLRERIREVRKKEKMGLCSRLENGWNYKLYGYEKKPKSHDMLLESVELVGIVTRTLGIVFLSGSFFIFLVSCLVHLYS
ncbi:hypothetical protein NMG60_11020597 [Bertholletia excelsa]